MTDEPQSPKNDGDAAHTRNAIGQGSMTKPRGGGQRRTVRPFPASSFKEATELAETMVEIAGGARAVRRITLFDHLGRSPESGPSRQAVTNSTRYGLTEGSYQADTLTLTDEGLKAVSQESSPRERARAQFRLAVEGIAPFKVLYERFSNNRLPAQQVMRDFLVAEQQLSDEDAKEAVELFIVNARDIGLLQTLSGAERILTLDHMLDQLPSAANTRVQINPAVNGIGSEEAITPATRGAPAPIGDLNNTCFYITPIGEEDSEQRKHADLLLGQIVEPAIEALGMNLAVVRADKLTRPGMISQ